MSLACYVSDNERIIDERRRNRDDENWPTDKLQLPDIIPKSSLHSSQSQSALVWKLFYHSQELSQRKNAEIKSKGNNVTEESQLSRDWKIYLLASKYGITYKELMDIGGSKKDS